MKWINIKEEKPKNNQDCWLCDNQKNVFCGTATTKIDLGFYTFKSGYDCLMPSENINYWMPYFTPDAPKD